MNATSADHRPCFVVSTGRCGSKMLARVVALHPGIGAFHEPRPWLNTEAYLRWAGRKGPEYVHGRLGQKRDDLIEQVEANRLRYVESSHFLSHLIPELRERYHARFIHLFRDGREFTRSGLERRWYEHSSLLAPIRTAVRRATGLDVGNCFLDHRLDPPVRYRESFERITWLWVEINRKILEHLGDVPEEHQIRVRLEDFGRDTIQDLLGFLGHAVDAELVERMADIAATRPNRTNEREIAPPDEWCGERRERFWEIAGNLMNELGYEFD